MIKRTYTPVISDQDIQLTLNSEDVNYSEDKAIKAELAKVDVGYRKKVIRESVFLLLGGFLSLCGGIMLAGHWQGELALIFAPFLIIGAVINLVWKLARSKIPASQSDPKKVMSSFIDNDGDFARVFRMVAPVVSKNISVETFSDVWQETYENIIDNIKFQETATCAECKREIKGLWSVLLYEMPDENISGQGYFLRCTKCNLVFCSTCFVKIPTDGLFKKHRYCPNCKNQFEQHLPIFLPDPKVFESKGELKISLEYEMDGTVACVQAKRISKFSLDNITKTDSVWDSNVSGLGDRGVMEEVFNNKAVKVGEKWFLLSAVPGDCAVT